MAKPLTLHALLPTRTLPIINGLLLTEAKTLFALHAIEVYVDGEGTDDPAPPCAGGAPVTKLFVTLDEANKINGVTRTV